MIPHRQCVTLAALLCGTVAQADVTARQVWDSWSDQMAIYGEGFTSGTVVTQGDTLIVPDVVIKFTNGEATVTNRIGTIKLIEEGDGTVSVAIPASYHVTLDVAPVAGGPSTVNGLVTHDNMTLIVSGDPDAMNIALSADRYSLTLESIEGEIENNTFFEQASVVMLDWGGSYIMTSDNLNRIVSEFNIGAIGIDIAARAPDGSDPTDDYTINTTVDIADISAFGDVAFPVGLLDMDIDAPFYNEGLAFDTGYSFGNLDIAFDLQIPNDEASGRISIGGNELAMAADQDGINYTGSATAIALNLQVAEELPFPIEASLAEFGFDFQIPLSRDENGAPRDVVVAANIADLAVNDGIWNLGDPANILPRDPLTVAVGLTAEVTPFFDFLDPSQLEAITSADVPGEINSVEITDITVHGFGADISGGGAFTFDNNDLETFPGFPRPQGEANFAINGINGLIDNLIEMDLIPQDQAMMPRLMMGMVTVPVGDDQLTSTIEVNREGHVYANGQRLR